jgi:transposase-like protein
MLKAEVVGRMTTISFARHQFPSAIIRHAVWLYARFTLSYRDAEELLAECGLEVSYETVRRCMLELSLNLGDGRDQAAAA